MILTLLSLRNFYRTFGQSFAPETTVSYWKGDYMSENDEPETQDENEEDEDFDEIEDLLEEDVETPEQLPSPSIASKTPSTSKIPHGVRISLFFRSTIGPGEKIEKLTVASEMPVRELSTTVGQIFGLDPQDFHLSISGRTMDPDDILSNYDLEDGLECLIIPVSTAGYSREQY